MSKKNFLFEAQPALFFPAWLVVCLFLLPVFGARADDTTNTPANVSASTPSQAAAGSTSGNSTNQDLTAMPLEQLMQISVPVVETASKFEQKATEAPADATVITSDEIKKYGWRTLGDLLGSVPGFYISYDHVYDYVGVSGVNLGDANNRILLLVNGHRINNDLNDSAPVDTSFILDMDLIDRVEIIRGPGSVLYGNNAFFAVINVITRQGKQIDGVEGSGTYGSYDEGSGRVTIGGQFTNNLQFLLSGTIYNNNGIDDLDFPEAEFKNYNNGVAHHMDADNFQSFFGSASYYDLSMDAGYINRDKVNPTAILGTTFNDAQSQIVDDRSYVTLKYNHQFDGGWDVLGDAYYDRSDKELDLPEYGGAGVFSSGGAFVQEQETGQWAGTEVQVNKKILDKDTLTFGGEYRNDFEQDVYVFVNGVSQGEPINTNRQNYGIFGQADVAILDNLRLNAGVRYDEYGNYTPNWSPRAALIYNPWQPSTFKFVYGTAFRDPNVLEVGNAANVQPEKISSYQFIYEQGINRFLRSSVMGYYDHMDDLIGLDSSGLYSNFDAHTLGAELALEAKWKEVSARLSYSLQRTVNRDTDIILADSPENMIKFNVSAPLYPDKIFAGLEVQYTSQSKTEYYDYLATGAPFVVPGPNSPGFTVVNFTLFSENLFVKNLELSASVYNLLNTKFSVPSANAEPEPSIPQNGINFRLKLTYRF
jgi:outer membrane receptor for ferrienterochelin and colicins